MGACRRWPANSKPRMAWRSLDGMYGLMGFIKGFKGFLGFIGFIGFRGFMGCVGFIGFLDSRALVGTSWFRFRV